jgi:D-proline reductase (dithiol) PrdB
LSEVRDLRLQDQLFVRTYRWRRIDPVPWAPLRKPLAECRLGLVSSAGLSAPGQQPFDTTVKGGDPSFREVPTDLEVSRLVETHRSRSWDHTGVARDKNLAFPIDRLQELVDQGRIGSVASHALSFMGSITAPGRLRRDYLPRAADVFDSEQVDIALLVPV